MITELIAHGTPNKHSPTNTENKQFVCCSMAVCSCLEFFGDVWPDSICTIRDCLCLMKFGQFATLSNRQLPQQYALVIVCISIAMQLVHAQY